MNMPASVKFTLVIGGISSGKSAFAEGMIFDHQKSIGGNYRYFTPAETPADDEMRAKVEVHRQRRPAWMKTVECGINPGIHLEKLSAGSVILYDSVGTLISRLMMHEPDISEDNLLKQAAGSFVDFVCEAKKQGVSVVAVAEEVGMTLVALSEAGRLFQRVTGSVNQVLAAEADEVYFITAGIPQKIK